MHTTFFTIIFIYLIGCLLSTMLCHPIYNRVCRLNEDDPEYDITDTKLHNTLAAIMLFLVALSSWIGAIGIIGAIIYWVMK